MARREGFHWRRGGRQPTPRQRQVLDLLVDGKTNAEIAVRLGLSVDGAKWHVSELLSQTGCEDRQALASWWRRERDRKPGWALLPGLRLRPIVAGTVIVGAGMIAAILVVAYLAGNPDKATESADAGRPSPTPRDPTPLPEEEAFEPQLIPIDAEDVPEGCPISRFWRLRPQGDNTNMLNAGTGDGRMAWLSWATITGWPGPTHLQAAEWSISREITGDAVLTGRQVDGDGVALFASKPNLEDFSQSIVLPAPHDATHLVYSITPSPGCWQYTLRADNSQTVITVYKQGEPIPPSCPVSPGGPVRPDIAPGIGGAGVWMISSQVMPWLGADVPIKTIWLFDESISGVIRLTGERIDGPGMATFASNDDVSDYEHVEPSDDEATVAVINARNLERLLLVRQPERTIDPPHDLRNDNRGYVFYSDAGCWRFTAETEQGTFEIVQYIYERPS